MNTILLADGGIWPLLVLWGVFMVFRKLGKKGSQAAARRSGAGGSAAPQAQGGILSELRRAMEELKRAELEQRSAGGEVQPESSGQKAQMALEYLTQRKQEAAQKRLAARRPRQVLPDEEEMSSEDVSAAASHGAADYDDEAEAVIKARRAAMVRRERVEVAPEGLSEAQRARRGSRQDIAIGSSTEHAEWHDKITAPKPAPAAAPRRGLARYADGTVRSAVVLAEILGPAGGHSRDA